MITVEMYLTPPDVITTIKYVHSLATFLGTPCQFCVGSPFTFRITVILCGINSTRCWKHSAEILVYIHMMASCSCCFVGCISHDANLPFHHISKCSIRLRPLEYIKLNFQETRDEIQRRLIILLKETIRRWVRCGHKRMSTVSNNPQVDSSI